MKAILKPVVVGVVAIAVLGCSPEKSPGQVYGEYNDKVIEGISFEEDKSYFSKRKQIEVESKFPQYMKKMNKSKNEVIESYLRFSQGVAKCKEIELISETISDNAAILQYSQKDICGNESTTQEKQVVNMIKENGWKIDDIQISL